MLADAESLFQHAKRGSEEFLQAEPFPLQLVENAILELVKQKIDIYHFFLFLPNKQME